MLIDGKAISKELLGGLKREVDLLGFSPVFCDVLVGSDPVSMSYVKIKGRLASETGFEFKLAQYPENISESELIGQVRQLNSAPWMCGLIAQLPLPGHINQQAVLDAIDPTVDVDCIGSVNEAEFYRGGGRYVPPTAAAIMHLLDREAGDLSQKRILVIGEGKLVGRPMAYLLTKRELKVEVISREISDLAEKTKVSDIVICGTGQPGLLKGDMVKPGSVVVDAGTAESSGQIVGDVEYESVVKVAGLLSPVPGGVGPITVACLMQNVLKAALAKYKK